MTFPTIRPALTLDFAKTQLLDPRITFSRASSATYVGSDGLIKTAPDGVARFEYDSNGKCLGLLIEEARTNLLLNSATLSTQSVTVTAAEHVLSFYGTGTVTLSGASTAGPLVGTGANDRVDLLFTPSAGSLTLTVTGSVTNAQLEEGSFPTSYIPTVGATVTRAADLATMPTAGIYGTEFTTINKDFGTASTGTTLSIIGPNTERTVTYPAYLTQTEINEVAGREKDDNFWRWRVLGSSFALPNFTTDGQVTVDWGDGTVEVLTTAEHTFTDGGGYHDIGFRLDSGTKFKPEISGNATHRDKVTALGPAPASMLVAPDFSFYICSNLKVIDPTIKFTGGLLWTNAFRQCTSLTSFPLLETTGATSFNNTWNGCTALTSFAPLDSSSVTNFNSAWTNCSSLTSFPLIDTSLTTSLSSTWNGCSSLESFPSIDTSSVTNFGSTWFGCSGLTSFPSININNSTNFNSAWKNCGSLVTFPANFFDSWTGTPVDFCFNNAWDNCSSLSATSVENILNSIDTSGQSAPASGVDIFIDYDAGSGTPSVATAVTNLKSRGWTITLNGVAQ